MERTGRTVANLRAALFAALGFFMVWAGHDVTDSVRTIVVVGGGIVAALGVAMLALAVYAGRSAGR